MQFRVLEYISRNDCDNTPLRGSDVLLQIRKNCTNISEMFNSLKYHMFAFLSNMLSTVRAKGFSMLK